LAVWPISENERCPRLTFAQAVAPPAKEEERDEDDEFAGQGGHGGINGPGAWMR
jgi:hypothetical protein